MTPKISIIMGVHNGAKTLKKCLDSIRSQTFSDWEFVICDDSSTDNTLDILCEYEVLDNRIRLIKNPKNLGLAASLNKCIELSRAKLLARQDADDFSHPERLEKQYAYMLEHHEVSVLGTNSLLIEKNLQWGHLSRAKRPTLKSWLKGSQVIHASTFIRKDSIQSVNCYNEKAIRIEDTELWIRMIHQGFIIETLQEDLYFIEWGRKDYLRKSKKCRIIEIVQMAKSFNKINLPVWKYFYLVKPMILLFLPNYFLYQYHRYLFQLNRDS